MYHEKCHSNSLNFIFIVVFSFFIGDFEAYGKSS